MKQQLCGDTSMALVLGAAAVGAALLGARRAPRRRVTGSERRMSRRPVPRTDESRVHIAAARRFNHSSSLMALSVLADSGIEHYRGSFENVAMYTPLLSATLSMLAGLHGGLDRRARSHPVRHGIYLFAAAAGLAGTGFHLYNVTKRTGGWSWNNLFYAAPLGAPAALLLSGGLGAIGERLRDQPADEPRLLGMPAGTALALAVSAGLMGTVGEVGLLHFRGAFQHPAMYAPVIIPPVTAALMAATALGRPQPRPLTRWWLKLTTWLGLIGVGFHARGVARCQGGWRNWSQNILSGPPLPAPPSFTAMALAGLAALRLRQTEK
jgi:hypothetical protein